MPRSSNPQTPLLALLRACSGDERVWLAGEADTSVSYLYHLATCKRTPSVALATRLCAATETLHKKTKARTPKISVADLACMCSGEPE